MSWVRLDDGASQHRKLLAVGAEAAWLWTCGLMYANRQATHDGFIPEVALPILYPIKSPAKLAAKLVAAGLWKRVEGGWLVHDFHDYQASAEQIQQRKAARAEAGRIGGLRSAEERRRKDGTAQPPKQAPRQTAASAEANASKHTEASASEANEAPSNPIPSPPLPSGDPPQPPEGETGVRRRARIDPSMVLPTYREGIIAGLRAVRGDPSATVSEYRHADAADVARGLAMAPDGLDEQGLVDWLRSSAAEYVRKQFLNAQYSLGWAPAKWVQWLNAGSLDASVPVHRAPSAPAVSHPSHRPVPKLARPA